MAAKQHTRLQIIFVFIRVHSWRKTFRPSGLGATKFVSARNIHPVYFAPEAKMKVKTLFTLIGLPLRVAGSKIHLRAASTAAPRSARWPLMALASTTSPISEIAISTSTVPVAFIFLAVGG